MKNKIKKIVCNDLQVEGGGVYVPMGIFPNISGEIKHQTIIKTIIKILIVI